MKDRRKLHVVERRPTKFHEWKPCFIYFNGKDAARQSKLLGNSYRLRIYVPKSETKKGT